MRSQMPRSAIAVAVALLLSVSVAAPTRAADGQLTFRLTLRGEVAAADAFALFTDSPEVSTDPERGFFCGPPVEDFAYNEDPPICAAGDYEITYTLPVGWTVAYTVARYPTFAGSAPFQPEDLYVSVVTVTAVPQVRYVVYDYSQQPTLPDVATAAPDDGPSAVSVGALLVGAGLLLGVFRRRRSPRARGLEPNS